MERKGGGLASEHLKTSVQEGCTNLDQYMQNMQEQQELRRKEKECEQKLDRLKDEVEEIHKMRQSSQKQADEISSEVIHKFEEAQKAVEDVMKDSQQYVDET